MGWAPPSKRPEDMTTWEKISHVLAIIMLVAGMVVIPIFWPILAILVIIMLFSGFGKKN